MGQYGNILQVFPCFCLPYSRKNFLGVNVPLTSTRRESCFYYTRGKRTLSCCVDGASAESPSFFFCHLSPSLSSVSSSWIKNFLLAFYCSTSGMTRFHPRLSLRSPHSHRTRKMHYTAAKEQKSLESSLWTIAER